MGKYEEWAKAKRTELDMQSARLNEYAKRFAALREKTEMLGAAPTLTKLLAFLSEVRTVVSEALS